MEADRARRRPGAVPAPPGPKEHETRPCRSRPTAHLTAADLTVRGIPARSVGMTLTVRQGDPRFDLAAEGLGGTIQLDRGRALGSDPKDDEIHASRKPSACSSIRSGCPGDVRGLTELRGRASSRASCRRGAELKDAGGKAQVDWTTRSGDTTTALGAGSRPRSARLPRAGGSAHWAASFGAGGPAGKDLDVSPRRGAVASTVSTCGSIGCAGPRTGLLARRGTAVRGVRHASGHRQVRRFLEGTAEFRVDRGFVNGLELTELRVPADWSMTMDGANRGALRIRKATGKLAGGTVGGDAWIALGYRGATSAPSCSSTTSTSAWSAGMRWRNRSVPGRISGFATINGPDPLQPASYRGELDVRPGPGLAG